MLYSLQARVLMSNLELQLAKAISTREDGRRRTILVWLALVRAGMQLSCMENLGTLLAVWSVPGSLKVVAIRVQCAGYQLTPSSNTSGPSPGGPGPRGLIISSTLPEEI